jgi:LacI family transcriptional regulator
MEAAPFVLFHHSSSIALCRRVKAGFAEAWPERLEESVYFSSSLPHSTLERPQCRGWAAFLSRRDDWDSATALSCPTVNYSNRHGALPTGLNIFADEAEVAAIAAEHLLARGYRRFAFVGSPGHGYSTERGDAFAGHLRRAGHTVDRIEFPERREIHPQRLRRERMEAVRTWLDAAAPPAGILCANDDIAAAFLRHAGEIAPERLPLLGVVGVDNLGAAKAGGMVELSSIAPNYAAIGAAIAASLAAMLDGETVAPGKVLRIGGARLVEGASSAAEASEDPLVMRLSARIRQSVQAGQPLRVEGLARAFGTSARSLQIRFSRETGRTLRDFFIAERLRRAERLLLETDHSVADIAYACGFDKHAALSTQFRRAYGCSPREFRKRTCQR